MRGITLMELLVTIAILGLVMALLGLPLLAAFGYIQKATARSEARRAGAAAIDQLAADLNEAMYIFDPPIDGAWVSMVKETTGASAKSLGMPMTIPDFNNPVDRPQATLLRYSQTLDFPWHWDAGTGTWETLEPSHLTVTASADARLSYAYNHAPYYSLTSRSEPNPFNLARMERSLSWASAQAYAVDGLYPLNTYPTNASRWQLWRWIRRDLVSVTPYGAKWDVARFQVTPVKKSTEALFPLADAQGRKNFTIVLTGYPLVAGRTRDIDDLYQSGAQALLPGLYGQADISVLRTLINQFTPLYPIPTNSRDNTNPFGYQLRVFEGSSAANTLVYGMGTGGFVCRRHYMEWPPLDRPDWTNRADWETVDPFWTRGDIQRQRLEGKFTFVQPMRATALPAATNPLPEYTPPPTVAGVYLLPIPDQAGTRWDELARLNSDDTLGVTYRVTIPRKIKCSGHTFKLVDKEPDKLGEYEFCLLYKIKGLDDQRQYGYVLDPTITPRGWQVKSRVIAFGIGMTDTTDPLPLDAPMVYTICDLQPTDTVVATYSTKALLNIALIVSRQDSATRDPVRSRQDYHTNVQLEAHNAAKRARGMR
ncbi:MAG: pilus assembly FimT family protein [Armatimonadota bacterium]